MSQQSGVISATMVQGRMMVEPVLEIELEVTGM